MHRIFQGCLLKDRYRADNRGEGGMAMFPEAIIPTSVVI